MTPDQRAAARNRVKELTGWIAGAATALTLGFAIGAARHAPAAESTAAATAAGAAATDTTEQQDATSSSYDDGLQAPSSTPSASAETPAATSGAS